MSERWAGTGVVRGRAGPEWPGATRLERDW